MILMPILVHWPELPKLEPAPYFRVTTEMLRDRKAAVARMMLEEMDRYRELRVDAEGVPCLVQAVSYIWDDRTYLLALFNAHYLEVTVETVEAFICADERKYREGKTLAPLIPLFEKWANEDIEAVRQMWSAVA